MKPADLTLTDVREDHTQLAGQLEAALLSSLRQSLPQAENAAFILSANDDSGALEGGLTASASYGWLLIKLLWVREESRHRGMGRSLMIRAEARGRELGCHSAWLDTSSPDAVRFYNSLGYASFAQLGNAPHQHPGAHRRWFMKKDLGN